MLKRHYVAERGSMLANESVYDHWSSVPQFLLSISRRWYDSDMQTPFFFSCPFFYYLYRRMWLVIPSFTD